MKEKKEKVHSGKMILGKGSERSNYERLTPCVLVHLGCYNKKKSRLDGISNSYGDWEVQDQCTIW